MRDLLFPALLLVTAPVHGSDLCRSLDHDSPESLRGVCAALAAVNAKDSQALTELMSDDFALVGVSGKYFPAARSEMVARWTTSDGSAPSGSSHLVRIFRVRQTGSTGIVSGEIRDTVDGPDGVRCYLHAFTDIWEKRADAWKWIHSHESGASEAACGSNARISPP